MTRLTLVDQPHCRGFMITLRHTTTGWTPLDGLISPTQRPLPDNTQQSKEKGAHASRGIRIHKPSKRVATYPRPRPRSHWDRQ